jgi:uncharacterized coiled-coil protein SlyX
MYYNGLNAAKRINISYKTLLRWLEKGKLVAEHSESGQLLISEDQVEKYRLEVAHERAMFRASQAVSPSSRQPVTDMDTKAIPLTDTPIAYDIDTRMASLAQSIANLNATVASQTRRIDELSARVAELEAKQSLVPLTERPLTPLYRYSVDKEESPKPQPQIRTTATNIPHGLPEGTLTSSEFAVQLGIDKEEFKRYMKRGILGEKMDITEISHHTREGYAQKYFTLEQQERAIDLLKKHGKL